MNLLEKLKDRKVENLKNRFFGLRRGIATNVNDPENLGRIKAHVHELFGEKDETDWASYCSPFGGGGAGFFFLPDVGDPVWIAFEAGDINHPVWLGFWFNNEDPTPADSTPRKRTLQTKSGHRIVFDDEGKTIRIEDCGGQSVEWNAGKSKIKITANMKVVVEAPQVELGEGSQLSGVVTERTHQFCYVTGAPIGASTTVKGNS